MTRRPPVVLALNALVARGGVELRAVDLARHLVHHGQPVEIWAFRADGPVRADLEAAGATVRHLHVYDYRGRAVPNPGGLLRLAKALRESRTGAIIGLQHPTHLYLRAVAAVTAPDVPVLAMERLEFRASSPSVMLAESLLARQVHAYVGVSRALRDDLLTHLPSLRSRIRGVEDGVRPLAALPAPDDLKSFARGRRLLGFVGSISHRKRPRLAVEVMRRLRIASGDTVALAIVGRIDDDPEFPAWLAAQDLDSSVKWFGQRSDVGAFLPSFDAFLFPSVLEGLGNVWIEAAQHGIPIVSTDMRPMNDYLRDGIDALLCPPDDIEAFAAASARILQDPSLARRLGDGARTMAARDFDPVRQMDRLMALALSAEEPGSEA